jgi:hypothetical protein
MMNALPLYDSPPHPYAIRKTRDFSAEAKARSTRTCTPVKYYFVDFGLSRRYNPEDGQPLELPRWGGDKSVPEFLAADTPCDPFPVDVYCLGNVIRQSFLEVRYLVIAIVLSSMLSKGDSMFPATKGLEFMKGLVADMVKDDPKQRPTMDEVVHRFCNIVQRLSSRKLRSRLGKKKEGAFRAVTRSIVHWAKQIKPIVRRLPPIPTP